MSTTPRRTLDNWREAPLTNRLCMDMEDAARKVGYVLDKSKAAEIVAYVCGDAGLGKSHAIRKALAERGLTGCFRTVSNYRDLIKAFEDAERLSQPLILEESDQVLWSERQANVLKEATDPAGRRSISFQARVPNAEGKLETVLKTVSLTAPLIITSNKDLRDPATFDRTMRPHVAALASRSAPIFLGADRFTQWEYSCYLAICHRMLQRPDEKTLVPLRVQDAALGWFTTNLNRLADGSPRTLKNVCKFISYNPDQPDLWERDLRTMIVAPEAQDFLPAGGVMPCTFPSEIALTRLQTSAFRRRQRAEHARPMIVGNIISDPPSQARSA